MRLEKSSLLFYFLGEQNKFEKRYDYFGKIRFKIGYYWKRGSIL